MAALNLTAEQLSNLLKTSNAANSSDKLPSFRGRARECDPMFDETTSFSTHITLLKSHISAIPNLSEYDKKTTLGSISGSESSRFSSHGHSPRAGRIL